MPAQAGHQIEESRTARSPVFITVLTTDPVGTVMKD